tara:strand:+ start:4527 stop:4937 length:411 start_codon:yes stop_codon:yes gene_type:complete
MNKLRRNDYAKLIEQYGKRKGRQGYDYVIHFTFNENYKKSLIPRGNLKKWYVNVVKNINIDGIINFDKDKDGYVYLHGVVICSLDINEFRMLMEKTWSEFGQFKFDQFNKYSGIEYYMSKFVNNEINQYDILVNLL